MSLGHRIHFEEGMYVWLKPERVYSEDGTSRYEPQKAMRCWKDLKKLGLRGENRVAGSPAS